MAIRKSKANEVSFKTVEECGKIGKRDNGWELKLRYGSWNGNEEKYDLRPWKKANGEEKCLKGITLSGEELEVLYKVIGKMIEEPEVKETKKTTRTKTTTRQRRKTA